MCVFTVYTGEQAKAAGYAATAFGGIYALCNMMVYFTQITTVHLQPLGVEVRSLLDYSQFGLMFNLDMLGYCLMAIATFFAGLTIRAQTTADKWLKWLLLIHGVFAPTCFVLPMLGLFTPNMVGGEWIGTAIMLFWCLYFTPVGALSIRYFLRAPRT